jgi:PPOX class probable F420-dependent enzyme
MRRLPWFKAVVRIAHRGYAHVRHRKASDIVMGTPTGSVEAMRGRRTCALATFKRDGTAVVTPVWYGLDGDLVYFRAEPISGKAKRLRNNSAVILAPCTRRGRPLAPAYAGTARILSPDEAPLAEAVIQAAFGTGRAVYERTLTFPDGVYVEVVPA